MTGTPALVLNGRLDILTANALGYALYSPVYADPVRPPNNARFTLPRPARHRVLPRLGQGRQRHRRHAARRGRPRPLRPGTVGPDRGAVHPQRPVPGPVGRPQRPDPHHRRQAHPPPGRRGPRSPVRILPDPRRTQPEPAHLHHRARFPLARRTEPARQLGHQPTRTTAMPARTTTTSRPRSKTRNTARAADPPPGPTKTEGPRTSRKPFRRATRRPRRGSSHFGCKRR